jgi:hypothetical protein
LSFPGGVCCVLGIKAPRKIEFVQCVLNLHWVELVECVQHSTLAAFIFPYQASDVVHPDKPRVEHGLEVLDTHTF